MNCGVKNLTVFIYILLISSFQIKRVSTQLEDNVQAVNVTRSDNFDVGDKVSLKVVNSSLCQDHNDINAQLLANCSFVSQETNDDVCILDCVCKSGTGSFILNKKQCHDERELREGCSLEFGAWSWSTGWVWNTRSDRLHVLYIEDGFGIEGAFNASATEYSECLYTTLSTYEATGVWQVLVLPSNESFISFFEMRNYWHILWVIEDLSDSKKAEIEGKFIKVDVMCENTNEVNGIVEVNQISSCFVFKVTGNISHEYNLTPTSSDIYSSTTFIPATTTDIPIQSLVDTPGLTSSIVVTRTPSQSAESTPVMVESSSVIQSSSVMERSPVIESSPVINGSPVIASSSIMDSSLAIKSSSVVKSSPVIESSPVNGSPVIASSPEITSSPVPHSTPQSTQAITDTLTTTEQPKSETQIGLILGIVVAGSAAVVIIVAVTVTTVTSFKNQKKRTHFIQNNKMNMRMKTFDNIPPSDV